MSLYTSAGPCRRGPDFDRCTALRSAGPVFVTGAVNRGAAGSDALYVAEDLRLLGRRVSLITLTGGDGSGEMIRERCRNAGIDLQFSRAVPSETGKCDELTPALLEPLLPALNKGAMLIADATLPEETAAWLARHITVPIAADPVSREAAGRLRPLLSRVTMIKPNVPEAEALTGMEIRGDGDLGRAADILHRMGALRVYISLGARGAWADDVREGGELIPCFPGTIVNTAGCGAAFVAGAADAFLSGLGTREAALNALAAAAVCASDSGAVCPELSRETVGLKAGGRT